MLAPVQIVAPPALYDQHSRIGGGLTPQQVSAIFDEAAMGYMYRLADLGNESRQKDGHLQSVLGTRELTVARMTPHLTPATESSEDKKIADWCNDWLTNFGGDSYADERRPKDLSVLLAHLQGAVFFGYATAETLFERDGRYVVPIGCEPVAPRRFAFDMEHGKLHFWDESGRIPFPGTRLLEAYPGRFVQHQPRINGDVESREGLIRVLVWLALLRNWGIVDWHKLAEMAWKPWRIGVYKKLASTEDINSLILAMQKLTTNQFAVLPETVDLKVEWAQGGAGRGNGGGHQPLFELLGREMSKAALGQVLSVEPGSSGGGSYSLGKEQGEVRRDIRDADAMGCASSIRRYLIAPAVRLNHGANARIPKFELLSEEQLDVAVFCKGVKDLADAGADVPQTWVWDKMQITPPKKGDELLGGRKYGEVMELPAAKPEPKEEKRAA